MSDDLMALIDSLRDDGSIDGVEYAALKEAVETKSASEIRFPDDITTDSASLWFIAEYVKHSGQLGFARRLDDIADRIRRQHPSPQGVRALGIDGLALWIQLWAHGYGYWQPSDDAAKEASEEIHKMLNINPQPGAVVGESTRQLDLYRKAVNEIDDAIEYSPFTKQMIHKILDRLAFNLSQQADKAGTLTNTDKGSDNGR